MSHYSYLLIGALLVSAGLMPILIRLARHLGIVDHPIHRKIHTAPIPYLGGMGIVAGAILVPAAYFYSHRHTLAPVDLIRFAAIVLPALAASLLGLADDKRSLKAGTKLAGQIVILLPFLIWGFRIEVVRVPGMGPYGLFDWEGILLTLPWMLGVINGVNLVDGVDGLAGSVAAVIFAAIALLALNVGTPDYLVAIVALAAMGATIGFLIFNWKPAKIYLGDSGSLATGTLIATLLVALGQRHRVASFGASESNFAEAYSYQFAKITLVAFYPLMEIAVTIVRRFLRGKPIGSADKGHVHHRLLRWGWSAPMICLGAVLISAIGGASVIATQHRYLGLSGALLACGGVLIGLMLHFCGLLELFQPSDKSNRPHFLIANHFIGMQRVKLELAQTLAEISTLTGQTCVEFGVERYSLRLAAGGARQEPLEMNWCKPASVHAMLLLPADAPAANSGVRTVFSDKQSLPSGSGATWSFEPHEVEDEIDVEYRVLFSDFMRKAIGCAEYIYHTRLDESSAPGAAAEQVGVSSARLRRRGTGVEKVPAARSMILIWGGLVSVAALLWAISRMV